MKKNLHTECIVGLKIGDYENPMIKASDGIKDFSEEEATRFAYCPVCGLPVNRKTGTDFDQGDKDLSEKIAWCENFTDEYMESFYMPVGKHVDEKVVELPSDYLKWVADNWDDEVLAKVATKEWERRVKMGELDDY